MPTPTHPTKSSTEHSVAQTMPTDPYDVRSTNQGGEVEKSGTAPLDKQASYGGHGTLEMLKVTQILEENGIPCCLVGTSALIYYGANRARGVSQVIICRNCVNRLP